MPAAARRRRGSGAAAPRRRASDESQARAARRDADAGPEQFAVQREARKSPVEKLLPPPEQPLPRRPAPITPVRPTAAPQIQMPPPEAARGTAPPAAARGAADRSGATVPAEAGQAHAPQPCRRRPFRPSRRPGRSRSGSARCAPRGGARGMAAAEARQCRPARRSAGERGIGRSRREGHLLPHPCGPLDEAAAERLCTELKRRKSRVHHCAMRRGRWKRPRAVILGVPASV